MVLQEVTSAPLDTKGKSKAVLLFGAIWHEGCAPLKAILQALAATVDDVFFGTVDAEAVSDLSEHFQLEVVPTILLLNNNHVMERLEGGVEASQLTLAVQRLVAAAEGASEAAAPGASTTVTVASTIDPAKALSDRLDRLIRSDAVMLFMKGVPTAPRCGFSRQAVELLTEHKVPFGSFDILQDEEVRQALKKHSNWPTYPQLYVNGELQGGLDILKELAEEGSLLEQWDLKESDGTSALHKRLNELTKRSEIMVFMKGLPSAPRCGFSRQLIEILDMAGVAYDAFDILQDEEVRQGLKEFSNWPTYPQLYVKGDLLGGLDIVQELQESGELDDMLQ